MERNLKFYLWMVRNPKDMRGKKDVISLEPGQKAKIEVVFKNTGTYMFHCHILEHEDNGMMGQIKVTN